MSSPHLPVECFLSLFSLSSYINLVLFHLQGCLPVCLYALHVHTWCPLMSEKGVWSLWNWSCKQLCASMWIPGHKPISSATGPSGLNYRAFNPIRLFNDCIKSPPEKFPGLLPWQVLALALWCSQTHKSELLREGTTTCLPLHSPQGNVQHEARLTGCLAEVHLSSKTQKQRSWAQRGKVQTQNHLLLPEQHGISSLGQNYTWVHCLTT